MLSKINYIYNKIIENKVFHIIVILLIILSLIIGCTFIMVNYKINGEKFENLPFIVDKINIISSISSKDISSDPSVWKKLVDLNNDIYIYIESNELCQTKDSISELEIDNIELANYSEFNYDIFTPDVEEGTYKNIKLNDTKSLIYTGSAISNIPNFKISNTGDILKLRVIANDVYEFNSQEKEIDNNKLLAKSGLNENNFNVEIKFDLLLKMNSGKKYRTNIKLELPIDGFIENGKSSKEIDQKQLIFKRE